MYITSTDVFGTTTHYLPLRTATAVAQYLRAYNKYSDTFGKDFWRSTTAKQKKAKVLKLLHRLPKYMLDNDPTCTLPDGEFRWIMELNYGA